MNRELKYYFYIFIAGSLWGTIGLFVKLMVQCGSSATYTSFLRMFIGLLLLIVITTVVDGIKALKVNRRTLVSCILLGLICQGIYNIFYSSAVNSIGMSLSSVLLYTSPIYTCIMSRILFKEKITGRKRTALLVNFIGCALTVTGGSLAGLSFEASGLLFGFGAGFCYSMAAIFGRIATGEDSPFAVATYNFLFASIFLALFTRPWRTVAHPLDGKLLLTAFFFALIPTALAYIFYFKGLEGIKESSKVPVVASIETVIATLLGMVVFHEKMGIINILGIVLLLGSIAFMNLGMSKKKLG